MQLGVKEEDEEDKARLRTPNLFPMGLVKKIDKFACSPFQDEVLKSAVISSKSLAAGDSLVEKSPIVPRSRLFLEAFVWYPIVTQTATPSLTFSRAPAFIKIGGSTQ